MTRLVLLSLCAATLALQPSARPNAHCDPHAKNFYPIMGIPASAKPAEIARVCRNKKAAFAWRTWKPECAPQFRESQLSKVREACDVLMNEGLRSLHDARRWDACPNQETVNVNCETCQICRKHGSNNETSWAMWACKGILKRWWLIILIFPIPAMFSWVPVLLASVASFLFFLAQSSPWLAGVLATLTPYVSPIANLVRRSTAFANQWGDWRSLGVIGFVVFVLLPLICRLAQLFWASTRAYRVAVAAGVARVGGLARAYIARTGGLARAYIAWAGGLVWTYSFLGFAHLFQGLCWVVLQLASNFASMLWVIQTILEWVDVILKNVARYLNLKANQWSGGAIPRDLTI